MALKGRLFSLGWLSEGRTKVKKLGRNSKLKNPNMWKKLTSFKGI